MKTEQHFEEMLALLGIEQYLLSSENGLPESFGLSSEFANQLLTCLAYNIALTALHVACCFLVQFTLSIGLKHNFYGTTGPVRPYQLSHILNFCYVDFITNIWMSAFFTWITIPSNVNWSLEIPGPLYFLFGLLSLQLVQDAWHYAAHRYLHATKIKWLYEMHQQHHRESKAVEKMNSFDLMNLHPIEYWITIIPAVLAGFWFSYAVLPFILNVAPNFFVSHVTALVTFSVECMGHSNMDVKVPAFMQALGYTSCADHASHHLTGRHNYAIFFTYLDKIFGTYQEFPQNRKSIL